MRRRVSAEEVVERLHKQTLRIRKVHEYARETARRRRQVEAGQISVGFVPRTAPRRQETDHR